MFCSSSTAPARRAIEAWFGKMPTHAGAALDRGVEPLQRAGTVVLHSEDLGENHEREHVGPGAACQRGALRELATQLVNDQAPLTARRLARLRPARRPPQSLRLAASAKTPAKIAVRRCLRRRLPSPRPRSAGAAEIHRTGPKHQAIAQRADTSAHWSARRTTLNKRSESRNPGVQRKRFTLESLPKSWHPVHP